MFDTFILIGLLLIILSLILMTFFIYSIFSKISVISQKQAHQYSLMIKMQSVLRAKHATNIVAENAEMIYQDLLQNLIPIMASLDIMPRNTSEHPLWRAVGGIMDEYARNPFTMEKLRRNIKLDSAVAGCVDNYLLRADGFLAHLLTTDSGGILAATFTDGLLGKSLTFFTGARALAVDN